jgi:hypothetical protein
MATTFEAQLADAEMQVATAGLRTTLWAPEFGWRTDETEASKDPYQLQILAGLQCLLFFFVAESKRAWVHLAAEMQAGKTGVVTALIRCMLSNVSKLGITPERIFIVTGMNDLAWVKQTKERLPFGIRSGVAHNGGLQKIVVALRGLAEASVDGVLKNVLIVIDESHIAASVGNRPNRLIYTELATLCPIDKWVENNIRVLTISATDPAMVAEMDASAVPNKIVRLLTNEAYQSVEKLKEAGRIRYAEDFGDLHQDRAIAEIKRAIEEEFPEPAYHILRPRGNKHSIVEEKLLAAFPGCSVMRWDSGSRPTSVAADGSVSMIDDINEHLAEAPEVHTFILLKNMFYASKTMDDTHVGILYDRVGGKDDTNLQSLVGRACGYGKSTRTVVYTSRQTVNNYLNFWQAVIRGMGPPPVGIPVERLDRRMTGTRVVQGGGGTYAVRATQVHAAPGGRGAGAAAHIEQPSSRGGTNVDNFTSEWKEFPTLQAAKAYGKRIHVPAMEGAFYKGSTTKHAVLRYDEVIAMQGGRITANMPTNMGVGKHRDRLYTCYRDLTDPSSAVFFVRRLTRIRAD